MNGGASGGTAGAYIRAVEQDITIYGGATLTGGSGAGFHSRAGIFADGTTAQTISVGGNLTLDAGDAGNKNDAGIWAYGGTQTLTVGGTLAAYGGTGGFDNAGFVGADETATGQNINAGRIHLQAGGGAAPAGYNNSAKIYNSGIGAQNVTLTGNAATVVMKAGSGTGALGNLPDSCLDGGPIQAACTNVPMASNTASISARGAGQTLHFVYGGGSLSLEGGSGGNNNQALVYLAGTGLQTISGAPDITLTAGSGGVYISDIDYLLGSHARIISTVAQSISAGSLTMTGGTGASSAAQAAIFAPGEMIINATGNVTLNGGIGSGAVQGATGAVLGSADDTTSLTINAGKSITATGNEGGVWLRGMSGSNVALKAGWDAVMPSGSGGNVEVSGELFADVGLDLFASAGSSSGANGNITQYAGSTITTGMGGIGGDITIVSARNTILNGTVSSGYETKIGAGFDPNTGLPSAYGGGISFGAGSIVRARNGVEGSAITAVTYGGDITQAASSQLILDDYGDVNILAYGDARMDGTTTIANAGNYGIYVAAGAENSSGLSSSFFGGTRAGSSNIVSIGKFDALGGDVYVKAAEAILRSSISNPNGPNIVADYVDLTSVYGGMSNALAISAITEATGSIIANVNAGASYGGISIINLASQPATGIDLSDGATNPGLNGGASISFYNAGDLVLGSGTTFSSSNSGDVAITSGGNLDYASGLTTSGGILLGAGGVLNMYGDLDTPGSLGLAAGGVVNIINSLVEGSDVTVVAPMVNITGGEIYASNNASVIGSEINITSGGYVFAGANASLSGSTINVTSGGYVGSDGITSVTGSTINIDGGFVGGTGNTSVIGSTINIMNGGDLVGANVSILGPSPGTGDLNLSYGGGVSADGGQLTFNLANVNASYGGGMIANGLTSNITGEVSGNITLDSGAFFAAGDDIKLALAGADSVVSLSNGSYMLADAETLIPATIFLDFLTRSSGGVMIDGTATTTSPSSTGSGFFVANGTPATESPGGGLVITYANSVTVDPCASSPDLCKPPEPTRDPLIEATEVDPCTAAPDSAQCKALKQDEEKDKQEKDQFGDEDGKKDGKSSQKKLAQCGI